MGHGDAWPPSREGAHRNAGILVFATLTWMGQPRASASVLLERLDAETVEKDERGRLITCEKDSPLLRDVSSRS